MPVLGFLQNLRLRTPRSAAAGSAATLARALAARTGRARILGARPAHGRAGAPAAPPTPAFPDATASPGPAPGRPVRPPARPSRGAPTAALLVTSTLVLTLLAWVWTAAGATPSRNHGLRATAEISSARDPFTVTAPPAAPPQASPAATRPVARAAAVRGRRHGTATARIAQRPALLVNDTGVSGFIPLYQISGQTFGVNWLLLASVHRQETAFSSDPTTYGGLNSAGCCGGPMQFNVTNGPVSTWSRYSDSFRYAARPASYPHETVDHPSIYDDFDAIMAAGRLLASSGATPNLDQSAWQAAYSYYGHDAFGVTYADEVVARAIMWAQHGFCPTCPDDPTLQAQVHAAYAPGGSGALTGATPATTGSSSAHRRARSVHRTHRPRQRHHLRRAAAPRRSKRAR